MNFQKLSFFIPLLALTATISPVSDDPSPALSPEQELATFQIEPGMKVQLVAAEPLVQAPITMQFDADGRLWVVEMRGYMSTIDGAEEKQRNGRVSMLEDLNGDGQMDRSTVYLDSLIMPRALAFAPGGVLVVENNALWLTKDRNGDFKADSKELIDKDYAGAGLPEHAPNGLWRGMDNWYYNAKSRFRYRFNNDGTWLKDSTEFRGQWGISHDDKGRLIYNYNWSQLHGDLVPPNYLSRNRHHAPTTGIDHGLTVDRRIYPIRSTPAVNRGYIPGTLDKQGRIQEFTAACSPFVYRETTFPAEYKGNIFVCEPAGNLIKRNVVTENGPIPTASDPHPGREFLSSTDERFRPVALATGADGALYVADFYRGIIQHSAYMTPYLKEQTLARKLVEPVNRGRIWRIVPQAGAIPQAEKLGTASTDKLIRTLASANGGLRDMAQRLLVEADDASVVPKLVGLAQSGANPHGRAQALWTLEGLKQSKLEVLRKLLTDPEPFVQVTAIRVLESLAKRNPAVKKELETLLLTSVSNPKASLEVCLQAVLSAGILHPDNSQFYTLLRLVLDRYGEMPLIRDAVMSSLQDREQTFLRTLWRYTPSKIANPSYEIIFEMLGTAIARQRNPKELTELVSLIDRPLIGSVNKSAKRGKVISPPPLDATTNNPGWREKAILSGLAVGSSGSKEPPVKLASAPRILSSSELDPTRRTALNALFAWPGQETQTIASTSTTKVNPLSADDLKAFAKGRQVYLTTCSGCHGSDGRGMARFAPPLVNSHWVTGDSKRLALILLQGMEGPVDVAGKVYNAPDILPVMPSHSTMDDASITAVLTYIRNEWGNQAGAMDRRLVSMTRITTQGRVVPWTAKTLDEFMSQAKETPKP